MANMGIRKKSSWTVQNVAFDLCEFVSAFKLHSRKKKIFIYLFMIHRQRHLLLHRPRSNVPSHFEQFIQEIYIQNKIEKSRCAT